MKSKESAKKPAKKIFDSKKQFHKEMAKLPIEEKIKILVEPQKMGINANRKFKNKKVWKI
jgi:hypothetical protein